MTEEADWDKLYWKLINSEYHYFHTENGVLLYGDCLEVMKEIPKRSVDLVLTDPPYNLSGGAILKRRGADVGLDEEWDYNFSPSEYFPSMLQTLRRDGNMFVFCADNLLCEWRRLFEEAFDVQLFFIWHKTNPTPQFRKVSFLKSVEFIMCGWNKGHKWNFKTQKEMHNFFECPIVNSQKRRHPTQKPLELISHLVEIASLPKDIVLDPFLGSGRTAIACEQLNRKWIGIEISEKYCEIAQKEILGRDKNQSALTEY